MRGGRDPELTARPTLVILDALFRKRLLPEKAKLELAEAYVFLRNVEHRLQYLDDAQTHELPVSEDDRARLAQMADFTSWEAFYGALNAHRSAVTRHFQAVFAEPGAETEPRPWPEHPRLAALRAGQRYLQLPDDSRRRFDALIPALAGAAAATPDPEATLARGVDLLEAIARRASYLALLAERPEALERVTRMIGASSWAADYVTRHPLLLDELLDDRVLYSPPDWREFESDLRAALAAAGSDVERQMNALREQHQSQQFRLLAQDLAGLLTVEVLADHLSQLADIVLQVALEASWAQVASRHCAQPRFAVIGYGKLGGKELGYASDLDIIFLYDDADERALVNYARLAQRYNNWLTLRTSAGTLFDTDLQLRPSGSSGLLVSSIATFAEYQEHSAWSWEHQALTRARYCAGDGNVGDAFERIRKKILEREREPAVLAREVLAMRDKLHAAHPNKSGLFDLKHDRGGMIDIEFMVQFLVLAHAHRYEELTRNLGNIALLGIAAKLGLIPAGPCRRLPQRLPQVPPPAARAAPERRAVRARADGTGGSANPRRCASSGRRSSPPTSNGQPDALARARPAHLRVELLQVGLHLVAAALVDDLPPHDAAGVGHAVARRGQHALHVVHALADHHFDGLLALAEDDDLHRPAGLGLPHGDLLIVHAAASSTGMALGTGHRPRGA